MVGGATGEGVKGGCEEEVGGVVGGEDDIVEEEEFVEGWEGGGVGGLRCGGGNVADGSDVELEGPVKGTERAIADFGEILDAPVVVSVWEELYRGECGEIDVARDEGGIAWGTGGQNRKGKMEGRHIHFTFWLSSTRAALVPGPLSFSYTLRKTLSSPITSISSSSLSPHAPRISSSSTMFAAIKTFSLLGLVPL